jgi:hypothetical protein
VEGQLLGCEPSADRRANRVFDRSLTREGDLSWSASISIRDEKLKR